MHLSSPSPLRCLCLLLSVTSVSAQPNEPEEADRPVARLETLTVEGQPEVSAGTSSEIADSLYGPHRTALEAPRAISVIPKGILDAAVIRDLDDLARVSTNTDTPNTFGLPSLPRIRGQEGEIFQNGLRRVGGNNGFGLPISFNSVERIDVVKGPPTPVLGPTRRVGGYVDLITKRPDLDAFEGTLTAEFGEYDHLRTVVDLSAPIEPGKSAVRISWEHLDEDSFYDFVETESDSVYLAYANQLTPKVRLDLNAEYYRADYSDNAGWNRVTQDLIDNGTYITGTGISPVYNDALTAPAPIGGVPQPISFADGSSSLGEYIQSNYTEVSGIFVPNAGVTPLNPTPGPRAVIAPGFRVNPDGTIVQIDPEVQLDRSRVLTDPQDFSEAETFIAQSTVTLDLTDDTRLTNRTHFQSLTKDQVNQNSFVEVIDELYVINNRTEYAADFDFDFGRFELENRTVSGLDLRFHHVQAFSQFTTEADNPIDLTAPVDTRRIDTAAVAQQIAGAGNTPVMLGQVGLVQLRPGVFVSPAFNYDLDNDDNGDFRISDTNETDIYQLGLFHQHDFRLTEQWSLLAGGRLDLYHLYGVDPAPPPGQAPVDDSITQMQGAANLSVNFQPIEAQNYYVTYAYSQSLDSALGGGVTLDSDTGQFNEEAFDIDSHLIEGGAKYSLFDDRLFLSVAGFYQTRSEPQFTGGSIDLDVKGAEFEAIFQPTSGLFGLFGVSYIDARFNDDGIFQGTRRIEDAFDDSSPGIIDGTAIGSPNFTSFSGNPRFPGLPRWNLNGLVSYTHPIGLGATLSGAWESEQNLDINGRVVIPAQFTLNTAIFYRHERFEVRLDVFNVTDEENFSPVFNGFFGADLVIPEEPRTFQLSLSLFL